jgi:crotonobetaine/carnitine-CoA ligase
MAWGRSNPQAIPPVLAHWADLQPDKVSTWFDDIPVTFLEMELRSTAAANALAQVGVSPGDTIGLLLSNCPEFAYVWFGAAKLGAIIVPINLQYKGAYLVHQLGTASTRVVIAEASLANRLVEVARELPALRHVFIRHGTAPFEGVDLPGVHVESVAALFEGNDDHLSVTRAARWDDPTVILFSSGTTGPSKGAVGTQNYVLNASRSLYIAVKGTSDDLSWTPLPLFHGNALCKTLLGPLMFGATGAFDPKFSVSRFWERVHHFDATLVTILGSMLQMVWNLPETELERDNPIRALHSVPIPKDLHHLVEKRWSVTLCTGYGLAEAFPVINSSVDDPPPPGYAGKPVDWFEVRLFDDEDHEVATGEIGEIVVRPSLPHVMSEGYFNNPDATVKSWRSLWLHTGDYGRKDANGFFAFVDRKKDALRRRGENISSFELENVIGLHPSVAESAVYAVPSEFSEDDVMVALILKSGHVLDLSDFMAYCEQKLPYFAIPRYVDIVSDFPRNPSGKIIKTQLRASGVTASTWDRDAAGYKVKR